MRNRLLGLVGVLWGGGILLSRLLRGAPPGGGAYSAGQAAGLVFAGVLLIAGLCYLVWGSGATNRAAPATRRRSRPASSAVASLGGADGSGARSRGARALTPPTLGWGEPLGYRLRLRGDVGLRLLAAGGAWALAAGVLCGLFAINTRPPGLGLAAFLGAVFGLGPAIILLFLRKPHVSGRVRADETGLHRVRLYAALTEMWSEDTEWPYEALSEAVIIPGAALGQPFSLLLLMTGEQADVVALPQRLERDTLVRLLASKGVSVRVGQEVPAVWRRPLATSVAVSAVAIGLAVLLGGAGFYLLRVSGRHTVAARPSLPETSRSPAAMALPRDTPLARRGVAPPAAVGGLAAGERLATAPAAPVPRLALPGRPMLRPEVGPGGAAVPPQLGSGTAAAGPRGGSRLTLPGAVTAPGQPGDSELVGGPGGFPFRLGVSAARPVLGFRHGLGSWAGQPALATFEPFCEPQPARQDVVTARDGYAVGAVKVDATTLVNAVQVVFMKLLPDGRLDPGDSYTADWIGRPSGRPPKVLGGNGQPVTGIHGRRGAVIDALGLVLAPGPQARLP